MSILNNFPKPTINFDFLQMQQNRNTLSALRAVVEQTPGAVVEFDTLRLSKKFTRNRFGVLTEAANNIPALDFSSSIPRGMLTEVGATNQIRNNSMVGAVVGTPGTVPTNWSIQAGSGLTTQVVATGVRDGVNYIRIRANGTASAITFRVFTEISGLIVATPSQQWNLSAWLSMVAAPQPPINTNLAVFNQTDAGVLISGTASANIPIDSAFNRYNGTITTDASGTTARIRPLVSFSLINGDAYDFTFEIGLPQVETGTVATSVIKTTNASANRAADLFKITGATVAIPSAPVLVANWSTYAAPSVVIKGLINPNGDNYLNGAIDNSFTLPFTASSGTYEATKGFFHRKHQIYLPSAVFTPVLSNILTRV